MNEKLLDYLKRVIRIELKWMYHYEVDDQDFGIETDKYSWCSRVACGNINIESLLNYFERNYSKDEQQFIKNIKDLLI